MATWKKVIVSGSNAELLTVTSSFLGNLTGTASYATNANSSSYALNSTSASYALNATSASYALNATSASYALNATSASYALNATTASYVLNAVSSSFASTASFVNTLNQNVIISGSLQVTNGITGSLLGTASYAANANSSSYALSASYAFNSTSASYAASVNDLTNAITNNVDNRVITATGGGTINGESNLTFDGTTLTVTGNAVITSNLTVQGTASFQNTTNLDVADRFILLASGSNTAGDGGIVVQQGTQNIGELFGFDSGTTRWAFTSSFNGASSAFTPDAFVAAAVIGANAVPTSAPARYQVAGNIFIGTDENIWIYS
jgi:hypothetical protein